MKKLFIVGFVVLYAALVFADITPLPDPPARTDPANFATKADAFLGALPTFGTEANALAVEVNGYKTDAEAAEAVAIASAATAQASANFKGTWSDQTGAAAIPYSVYHEGNYWQLVSNLADVTASEPGATASWKVIGGVILAEDLDQLQSFAVVDGAVVYLKGRTASGDGGQGVFVGKSGDFTSEVTADTLSGIYAPSDADSDGSEGCWVRSVPNGVLTFEMFGAAGDGTTNDQDAIDGCITVAGAGGRIEGAGNKNYVFTGNITPLDGQTFDFKNSTLTAASTAGLHLSGFWLQEVDNVRIKNLVGDGNRGARTGTNGGGFIYIGGCKDIILDNIYIDDPAADGITIGYYDDATDASQRCERLKLTNVKVTDAYRNGISIAGAIDSDFINIICTGSAGTNPQSGIDVEADHVNTASYNLRFVNAQCDNNAGFGFGLNSAYDTYISVVNLKTSDNGTYGVLSGSISSKFFGITGSGNGTALTSQYVADLSDLINDHRTIQRVRATLAGGSGADVISSSSYVNGAFTASITTKYASSAIIGKLTFNARAYVASGTAVEGDMRVVYDPTGTPTAVGYEKFIKVNAAGNGANVLDVYQPITISFYDVGMSRGDTRVYAVQGAIVTGDTLYLSAYELELIEIAAF